MKKFDKLFKFYFLISIIFLSFAVFLLWRRVEKISSSLPSFSNQEQGVQNIDICGPDCKKEIQTAISSAIATLSASPKVTTLTTPSPLKTKAPTQTSYIPLSGPVTTTSTDWVDVPGTDTYIDLKNDFGVSASVSWNAFLSVANSNGQAFARLFDVTHGIAIDGSVISTVNNSSLQQVSSGSLNLWAGRNLYRVQIKSLNSFTVTFGSGRIKITY